MGGGFADQVRAFRQKTGIKLDVFTRKVVLDLTSNLVQITPVLTGLAKNSYYPGYERVPDVGTVPNKSGADSINRAAEFTKNLKAGGVFYITNNLPYIMALEYGHSQQAPAGMARITVDRWQQIVNKWAAELAQS